MKERIPLSDGSFARVDPCDVKLVGAYRWHPHSMGYAVASGGTPLMHRLIMDAPKGVPVDHEDGDRLNNRRSNLRVTTYSVNGHNRHKPTKSPTGVVGVRSNANGRFHTYIWIRNVNTYVGTFPSLLEAAKARAEAERQHFGEIFPNTRRWLAQHEGD